MPTYPLEDKKLKEILVQENYLSRDDLDKASQAAKTENTDIFKYLIKEHILTQDLLGQAIAEALKLPYADLNTKQPPEEEIMLIPEAIAKKYRVVVFDRNKKNIVIACDNPAKRGLTSELKNIFKQEKISLAFSLPEDIDAIMLHYRAKLQTRFSEILRKTAKVIPEIVEEILKDAVSYNASDIHFEPQENDVVIRFRVDGVLQEAGRIAKEYYGNIVNRIKVQAHLRIDEHGTSQDGSFRFSGENKAIDMRVSVVPTMEGEKIVVRVLSQYVNNLNLETLGIVGANKKIVETATRKPFGMIIISGPTGSGKTTTLYAMLKLLNTPGVNITTIEDPVEFRVKNINQIQVNNQANLTFYKGLRSVLRQDPDIILVGEIRDKETAEIAVNAALTGHLLLSTFHANDAATTIPRLIEMGVERFLMSSTLELIIAQRLLRKLCDNCRVSYTVKLQELEKTCPGITAYSKTPEVTLYKAKGCNACQNIGYTGRLGVFELLAITAEMKDLIMTNPPKAKILELAKKQGFKTLFEDGWEKVTSGLTTLEELTRVVSI